MERFKAIFFHGARNCFFVIKTEFSSITNKQAGLGDQSCPSKQKKKKKHRGHHYPPPSPRASLPHLAWPTSWCTLRSTHPFSPNPHPGCTPPYPPSTPTLTLVYHAIASFTNLRLNLQLPQWSVQLPQLHHHTQQRLHGHLHVCMHGHLWVCVHGHLCMRACMEGAEEGPCMSLGTGGGGGAEGAAAGS